MVIKIDEPDYKEQIAQAILTDLPEWFGLPESTANYIKMSKDYPFFAWIKEQEAKGFLVLKETSPFTMEIYVMGVKKVYHHQGIGRELCYAAEQFARENSYEFMQVKTVQKGHYEEYDVTNAFYESMGFKELECLPNLWDEWNPCQIYIKGCCN